MKRYFLLIEIIVNFIVLVRFSCLLLFRKSTSFNTKIVDRDQSVKFSYFNSYILWKVI